MLSKVFDRGCQPLEIRFGVRGGNVCKFFKILESYQVILTHAAGLFVVDYSILGEAQIDAKIAAQGAAAFKLQWLTYHAHVTLKLRCKNLRNTSVINNFQVNNP